MQTSEELLDVHRHFSLYYDHLLPKMQEKEREKKKKEREERKLARRMSKKKRANVEDDEESVVNDDGDEEIEEADEPEPDEVENEIIKPAPRNGQYAICRRIKLGNFPLPIKSHVRIRPYFTSYD